jgi:hypothetical protein
MPIDTKPTQATHRPFDIEGMIKRKQVTKYEVNSIIGVTQLVAKRGDARYGPPLYWDARCTVCGHEHVVAHRNLHQLRNRLFCLNCSPTRERSA